MKEITSETSTFEDLIKGNYLYVDKTEYIWNLVKSYKGFYFLSRPRRFGKSLTVSTLEAVFQGRQDLFEGLAISQKPYDWKAFPIIHLSFADYTAINNTIEKLNRYLVRKIWEIGKELSVSLTIDDDASQAFAELMEYFKTKGEKVVILIDEYDKPILDNISDSNIGDIQKCLKGFYGVLKDRDKQERFLFVTGVSKFSHVSLFSGLNNLTDITMDAKYSCMFGYTQDELETYFADRIASLADESHLDEFKTKIKDWYDGYRFEETSETVYNPVSLAKFFESGGKFKNYWFSTGTPKFLLDLMAKKRFDLEKALEKPVSGFAFDAYDVENLSPLTLLLQTGYLTIESATKRYDDTAYQLRFPNQEVKGSFETYFAAHYSGMSPNDIKESVFILADAVSAGKVDDFMEAMKIFFAKVPYDLHMKDENNFHLLFYAVFVVLGISITAESKTNNGRIDAVAANDDFVFVFEFKLDKTAEIAMDQIKDRDYYRRYMNSGKKIFLVGVNFDKEAGQIDRWIVEDVKR